MAGRHAAALVQQHASSCWAAQGCNECLQMCGPGSAWSSQCLLTSQVMSSLPTHLSHVLKLQQAGQRCQGSRQGRGVRAAGRAEVSGQQAGQRCQVCKAGLPAARTGLAQGALRGRPCCRPPPRRQHVLHNVHLSSLRRAMLVICRSHMMTGTSELYELYELHAAN